MGARLSLRAVSLNFGGISVLDGVGFDVEPGMILGLVGPNGAGKTSLFNCISGHYRPSAGQIMLDDRDLLELPAWRLAYAGIGRTFQHPALTPDRTVLENVLLGGHVRAPKNPLSWMLTLPQTRRAERNQRARALRLLERLGLGDAAERLPDELSHGLHKSIELCRALMSKPRLLLLDEPAAGLSHTEVGRLIQQVREIRDESGVTIVIVEHHMGLVAELTDRVVVLDHGKLLMEGTAAEARQDLRVIEAYLGAGSATA